MKEETYNSCAFIKDDKTNCYTNKDGIFNYSPTLYSLTTLKNIAKNQKECSGLQSTQEPQSQLDCPANFKFIKDFVSKNIDNKLSFGNSCVKLDTDEKSVLCYSTQDHSDPTKYSYEPTSVLSMSEQDKSFFNIDTMIQDTKNYIYQSSQPSQRIHKSNHKMKFSDYNQFIRTLNINI